MRVAIISDIHANIKALHSVFSDIDKQHVEAVYSLGDLVGYGPRPNEVVEFVQRMAIPSVMGNHDYAINFVEAQRWFNPDARTAVAMTIKLLSDGAKAFLKDLPRTLLVNDALLVHGCPPDSFKTYIFMVSKKGIKRILESTQNDIIFVGHTHELMLYTLSDTEEVEIRPLQNGLTVLSPKHRFIINAGSVGQPRDGDPRAKYVIWDTSERSLDVRFVEYDVEGVAREIIDLGLPEQYARRLLGRRS